MKKIYLLIVFCVVTVLSQAQNAVAVFETQDRSLFYLMIDGEVKNIHPQNRVEAPLQAGYRNIRIIFQDPRKNQVLNTFQFSDRMKSFFQIGWMNGQSSVFQTNSVYIDSYRYHYNYGNTGRNYSNQNYYQSAPQVAQPRFAPKGYYCNGGSVSKAMLMGIKNTFLTKPVMHKRDYILSVISQNCWYSMQIEQLIQLVDGADDKMELAKFAYVYTTDTDLYRKVVNQLPGFKREEFMRYVQTNPEPGDGSFTRSHRPAAGKSATNTTEEVAVRAERSPKASSTSTTNNPNTISSTALDDAKVKIKGESFSAGKLAVVDNLVASNSFTAAQVKILMGEFSFEADKLEVAKKCYAKTIDKENYAVLNDAFAFDASVKELNTYISSK